MSCSSVPDVQLGSMGHCAACGADNDVEAGFCSGCAANLGATPGATAAPARAPVAAFAAEIER